MRDDEPHERTPALAMIDRPRLLKRATTRVLSDGSLTKKASLYTVAMVFDYVARLGVGFVLNPFLLSRLGDVGFGRWQFLDRLIGQASPAGGRSSEALKWFIAQRQSSDDLEVKRRAVGSAIAVWVLFIPVIAVLGGTLAWFAPIWLRVPPGNHTLIRVAGAILVADLILSGLANVPQSILQGENLGYRRIGLTTSLVLLGGALMAAAMVVDGGLVGLALASAATTAVTGALFLTIARRFVPWFGIARPDGGEVRRFVRLSWWFLLWNFVMKVTFAGDIVVLGIAASSRAVTTYSLARFVPFALMGFVTIVVSGIMPGLGGVIGAGERDRAADVRGETMAAAWLIAAVSGAGVLLWQESFMSLWVGARYYPGAAATLWIVVMMMQFALLRVDSNIIDVTLELRRKVLLGVASIVLSVGLAFFLVGGLDLGIEGLVIGFIAGRAVQSVTYPFMAGRIVGVPAAAQLRAAARPALVTVVLFLLAVQVSTAIEATTWLALIGLGLGSTLVIGAAAFFAGLTRGQRSRLMSRARRVIRLR